MHAQDGRLLVANVRVVHRLVPTIVALGMLIVLPSTLFATPRDVVADYFKDGTIDMAYSIDDLRGALVFARRHASTAPQYTAFADAVNQAITDSLVGSGEAAKQQLTTPRARAEVAPPPAPVPTAAPAPAGLPAPPQGEPAASIPWIVPVMGILAGTLVLVGIGSSIWRRMRP